MHSKIAGPDNIPAKVDPETTEDMLQKAEKKEEGGAIRDRSCMEQIPMLCMIIEQLTVRRHQGP